MIGLGFFCSLLCAIGPILTVSFFRRAAFQNLHKFAQKTFLKQVELALVFPSRLRFYLPVKGRKAALRGQRFNAELGGYQVKHARVVVDVVVVFVAVCMASPLQRCVYTASTQYPVPPVVPPAVAAAIRAANNALDERKDVVTTWSEKGTLKAHLREFVVRRLFEVVLNHGYLKLLPQLLASDVRMTGGSPQVEYLGMEQVYAHYRHVWNAFEDFECVVIGISFDAEGMSTCRWRISGVHVKPLWDNPPSNKPVVFYGITQITYEQGQFRLQRLRNFYRSVFVF